MKKRIWRMMPALLICVLFSGCGKVQSVKSLYKAAKREHGACEIVSQTETKDRTEVILRDELQGFEYKVYSYMYDLNIDGSSFGSLPQSTDGFSNGLYDYVFGETKDDIEAICKKYGISFDKTEDRITEIKIPPEVSDDNGIKAVQEIAAVIQQYNLENRLDGMVIDLSHDDQWKKEMYDKLLEENGGNRDGYVFSSAGGGAAAHIGSVKLPDTRFRDKQKESEDYYLEMAQMKNRKAVFVRSEKKTFADTGLSLDRVAVSYYDDYPQTMSDPVTFYYFSADGKEFYICDFLDSELQTTTWYSNYDEVFDK